MNRNVKLTICLLIAGIISFAGLAWGQDIKARMHSRLPVIVDLKAKGIVGENNQGYLTVLKKPTNQQAVIDAENKDRQMIYSAIAKKQNTTPALVGQRRALQIADKASPGTMVQDANGKWHKR